MPNEAENAGYAAELEGGAFLESESPAEERLPERQYCVFAPAASAFASRCSKSRKLWTGRS